MIFKRSLTHELYATALATFLTLMGIMLAQRTAYYLGLAARGNVASDAIVTLLGFTLLKLLPLLLTLTLFLSVLLTLTRWHRDSEMVVWFTSGLGLAAWVRPVMGFALPVIVIIAGLSLIVSPLATDQIARYSDQLKARDELSTITPGVFEESGNADRVYFIESFDKFGTAVKNIFVQSVQHQKLGVILARSGTRETHANGDNFIVLQNGRRYQGTPGTREYTVTEFERYAIRIEPNAVQETPPDAKRRPSGELLLEKNRESSAELHWRLSTPISAFLLVLLAIPLSFVDPRAGRSINMVLAVLGYWIYNNLMSINQAWLQQGKIQTMVGLWPVHALVLALVVYLFYRRLFLLPLFPTFFRKK
ncbi:MAG: LPS export ABC transporter permease LptF [Methylobacillus sp.]|jgi:lipopolysaccharide export system permease protein|nr:LPS export ABC transporter permease LptF [Methylobacillus sp.]